MTHLGRRTVLLTIPAIMLASCADDTTQRHPSTASAPTSVPPTALDGVPIQSDGGGDDEPRPAAADTQTEEAARQAALATMRIWVRGSSLNEQDWRKQLNKTLTPEGQKVAERRWGYTIEDHKVTGSPAIIRANAGSAVLHVATDYTTYEVTVIRTGSGVWKTSNLTTNLREGQSK